MSTSVARLVSSSAAVLRAAIRARDPLTIDQLRGDLSHETAAKLARLSGLVLEWREGRFRPGDPDDMEAVLGDLRRLCLRHARLASARFGTFGRMARLVATIASARAVARRVRAGGAAPAGAVARLTILVDDLRSLARALVEILSARYATRFSSLVSAAADEVRRECGSGEPGSVPVTLEGAGECPGLWIVRDEAVLWADLLRNFMRNAVQATEDRRREPGRAAADSPAIAVRLRPLPGRPGAALEIMDEGVGMSADQIATMWRTGASSHGAHHGQGLTEGKHAFLESRAGFEVRSAVGVGTCVRLEVPQRDVPIRAPRLWALPPIAVPLALVLVASASAILALNRREVVTVETKNRVVARGMDARGWVVWQRNLGEPVLENYLGNPVTELSFVAPANEFLMLDGPTAAERGVVLATAPAAGPGRVWRLDTRGRTRWVRPLRWATSPACRLGTLRCDFEVLTPWSGDRRAIALDVTNGDWSCTSLQFVTPEGDSVGAYYHPGPLRFFHLGDVDHDGRTELVLMGRTDLPAGDPIAAHGGMSSLSSVILLEPPAVSGQAFPWSRWEGMAPAREEACLLVPPLGWNADASIRDLRLDVPSHGGFGAELQMADGRIYRLDARLRPLSCGVAERTAAAALAPARALAPLVYLSRGMRENIDLPIRREP